MDCVNCGKIFFGDHIKFCSMKCFKEHSDDLKKDSQPSDKKQSTSYENEE